MLEPAMIEAPRIAPDHEAPKEDDAIDPPRPEAVAQPQPPRAEMPVATPFRVEPVQTAGVGPEAPQASTTAQREQVGQSDQRDWNDSDGRRGNRTAEGKLEPEAPAKSAGKRRFAAVAAMLAVAVVAGAAGGALATAELTHLAGNGAGASSNEALDAAVARIDADIVALKAGLEQTSKASLSQLNKTSDRLDRIEKAQVEPAAKLAKLSDAVDKLRAAAAATVTSATAAPADANGGIRAAAGGAQTPPTPQPAPVLAAPKTDVGRLPTVEGWVLRDVGRGAALIESRKGLYEVYAGDAVPGLGRVDAIRRQEGRWVVVTTKGLIVAR
jgi:hypothetical protein